MIKRDNSGLQIKGSLVDIEADLTLIIKKVREDILIPVLGEENSEKEINRIIELSKKSEDEVREEAKAKAHEIFEDIFNGVFGKK